MAVLGGLNVSKTIGRNTMSISLLLFTSVLSSLAFLTTLFRLSKKWTKRMLGYEVWVDAIIGGAITILFGLGGTVLGLMTGITTSLFFGLVLIIAKHLIGYSRYENKRWVDYEGDLTISAVVRWFKSLGNSFNRAVDECKSASAEAI